MYKTNVVTKVIQQIPSNFFVLMMPMYKPDIQKACMSKQAVTALVGKPTYGFLVCQNGTGNVP